MSKVFKSCSLKFSHEEYMSLRNLHTEMLQKGLNITLHDVMKNCIDMVSQGDLKEEYFKFIEKNKKYLRE